MGAQTTYTEQLAAIAGMAHGIDNKFETGVNDLGTTRNRWTVTISGNTAGAFSISVAKTGYPTQTVSFTAVSETITQIRDALIDALRALQILEGVAFVNPVGVGDIIIDSAVAGDAIVVAEVADPATDLAVVETTANVALQSIQFGFCVARRSGGTNKSVQIPSAAGDLIRGFVKYQHGVVDPNAAGSFPGSVSPGQDMSILRRGEMWVPYETGIGAVEPVEGETAWAIFSATGGTPGKVAPDGQGTAKVVFATVSGNTDGQFSIALDGHVAAFVAATSTADEIVTGLAADLTLVIAQNPDLAGRFGVVANLTDDRVEISALNPGENFTVTEIFDPGTDLAVTDSVAGTGPFAIEMEGVRFKRVDSATGLALLEVNLP